MDWVEAEAERGPNTNKAQCVMTRAMCLDQLTFCRGVFVKVPFAAAGFLFCAGSMLQVTVAYACGISVSHVERAS